MNSSQGLYGGLLLEHFASTSLHTSCQDLYHSPGAMWVNLPGDLRSSKSKSNMSFCIQGGRNRVFLMSRVLFPHTYS